jgi:anti-sigma B factor antagonist
MFSIEHEDRDGACRIAISGEVTIYSAAELKDKLLAAAAGSALVELDLADVSEFDSAGVQLLALLQHEARGRRTVHVTEASAAVQELLDLYGLSAEMIVATPAGAGRNGQALITGSAS